MKGKIFPLSVHLPILNSTLVGSRNIYGFNGKPIREFMGYNRLLFITTQYIIEDEASILLGKKIFLQ